VQTNIDHENVGNEVVETESVVQRIPFQITQMPPQAEIDAWHARVDKLEMV
jgi:hypothetical protein